MLNKLADCCSCLGVDVYLVGGFVRDWLLYNKPGRDIDIAVLGSPTIVAQAIADKFGGTVISLGADHGVVRVVTSGIGDSSQNETGQRWPGHELSEQDQAPWTIDVEGYSGTIEEDLQRRDFSINAMAIRCLLYTSDAAAELL